MAIEGNVKKATPKNGAKKMNFFRDIKAEAKRITWPSKEDTKKAFLAVLVFTIICMILVGVMDYGFEHFFNLIFKLKK